MSNNVFLISPDKISSVEPIAESANDIWQKVQHIKSVSSMLYANTEMNYETYEDTLGAIQANSLLSCLNLIATLAEEVQAIVESKIENNLG